MTTSRLAKSAAPRTSKFSAMQWAQMAREKGLMSHAELWEQAYRDGWDEDHYRPDPNPRPIVRTTPIRKHIAERDRRDFTPADWAELNEWLDQMGATARYRPDGTRYSAEWKLYR